MKKSTSGAELYTRVTGSAFSIVASFRLSSVKAFLIEKKKLGPLSLNLMTNGSKYMKKEYSKNPRIRT